MNKRDIYYPDLITTLKYIDKRGYFEKVFPLENTNIRNESFSIKQINKSYSTQKGTIRGMHYQRTPYAEGKLIYCLKGTVCDVIVDIRTNSESYLHVSYTEISESKNSIIYIPPGFAHGFQTLTENCELLYIHDTEYMPKFEDVINPLDTKLNIKWPLKLSMISDRDLNAKGINEMCRYQNDM